MPLKMTGILLIMLLAPGLNACVPAHQYVADSDSDYARPSHHYDYYYYPQVGVYFHLHSGHYFYRKNQVWLRVKVLPKHLYLDHRDRRHLVIRNARPYLKYQQHKKQYHHDRHHEIGRNHDRQERERNHKQHRSYRERPKRHHRRDSVEVWILPSARLTRQALIHS